MVYWAILFYQDYRNHAKSNGKSVAFFVAKGLLSQTLLYGNYYAPYMNL
ncbi:hypothetical protein SCSC_1648 [Streptococcus constellatus subsp. constellatus]|nr:hypothetical protein SCSC_1648 [Streptococcus constellatus subsp. constellatus]